MIKTHKKIHYARICCFAGALLHFVTVGLSSKGFSILPGFLADRCGGSYMPAVYIFLAEAVICTVILYITYRSVRASGRKKSRNALLLVLLLAVLCAGRSFADAPEAEETVSGIAFDTPVEKPQPHYADVSYVETPAERQIFSYVQTPYTYYKVRRWVGSWHRIEAAGQTFLNFGCGICCLTNMFDTILHRDVTPDRMFEKCREHSSYSPGGHIGAIDWDQIKTMCDYFGFCSELKKKPADYAEFQKDAAGSKTLMVLVCKDNDSRLWYWTHGHYVNLWEYDPETDSVFVTDPSGLYNRERVQLSDVYRALKTGSKYQYLTVEN